MSDIFRGTTPTIIATVEMDLTGITDRGVALASEWVGISVGAIIQDGVIEDVVN